jgi:hypothetical protein
MVMDTPTGIIITEVIIMEGMAIRISQKDIIRKNRTLRAVPGSRFKERQDKSLKTKVKGKIIFLVYDYNYITE